MLANQKVKADQWVEIIYQSQSGEITKRTIKIYGSNKEKIFGYCFMRKDYRSFYKEQILAMIPKKRL
ncbi:hypothetical protein GCM10008986_01540 [Salinibacillus aidingensis]|uniref:WYL domain-containing protein n=1 Tax=Salinibacillus aidingensis TaxID=237684 RepID=A0ABP3KLC9_9BACI